MSHHLTTQTTNTTVTTTPPPSGNASGRHHSVDGVPAPPRPSPRKPGPGQVGKGPEDVVWRVCGKAAHAEKVSLAVVTSYEVLKCVASDDEGGGWWGLGHLDGWIGFVWVMEFEVVVGSVGEVEGKKNSVLGCVCFFFFHAHFHIFHVCRSVWSPTTPQTTPKTPKTTTKGACLSKTFCP